MASNFNHGIAKKYYFINDNNMENDRFKFLIVKRNKICKNFLVQFKFFRSSFCFINKNFKETTDRFIKNELNDYKDLYYIGKVDHNIITGKCYFYDNMDILYGNIVMSDDKRFIFYRNYYNRKNRKYLSSILLACEIEYIETTILGKKLKSLSLIYGNTLKNLFFNFRNNMTDSENKYVNIKNNHNDLYKLLQSKKLKLSINSLFSYSFFNNKTLLKIKKFTDFFGDSNFNLKFYNYNNKLQNKKLLDSGEKWNDDCAICLENVLDGEKGYVKLSCSHVYHTDCFEEYCFNSISGDELIENFSNSIKCPCCNSKIQLIKDIEILKCELPNLSDSLKNFSLNFKPLNVGEESKKNISLINIFGDSIFKMLKVDSDHFAVMYDESLNSEFSIVFSTINLIS